MPAAEEERHDDGRAGDHGGVFAEEKESELHRAVFGVITADQFRLGLGKIERQPVRFGENRDRENDERNEHREWRAAISHGFVQSPMNGAIIQPCSIW